MTEPLLTEEKTPLSIPSFLTLAKPPALMSTPGGSPTSLFGSSSFQSSAGNQAVQRAAEEPDRITTPEGDSLPAPVVVGWAESFEISFSTRTTSYGDVKLRVRFRYLGTQTPERATDLDQTREIDPAPENPETGVPQNRRLDVRIVNYNNVSFEIDPYGDRKVTFFFEDELLAAKPNGARDHHITVSRNGKEHGSLTMSFTAKGGKPVPESGLGTMVLAPPPPKTAAFEPDPESTPDLSMSMLVQMALSRLAGLKIKPKALFLWDIQLRSELPTNMSVVGEPKLRRRLRRLLDLLAYMGPVLTTLEAMRKKDQYLGGLADVATERVEEIIQLYGPAILASYYSESPTNEPLAIAEKALAEFPGWLNNLYLIDPRGVRSLIEKIPALQDELRAAQDLNDPHYEERLHRSDMGHNRLERVTMLTWKGKGPGTLYGTRESERVDVEWAWRGEKDYVADQIQSLYARVQGDIGLLTAMTVSEQLRYISHELNESLINDVIEVVAADREDKASSYATELWHICNEFEESSYLDGKEKEEAVQATLKKLEKRLGPDFQSDVDDFQSRLKWINRIDFIGKLALIVAAAALTGGVAGSIAAELGAGGLLTAVASGFGFTVASRLGQQLAFGKVEGSFIGDWFWNTVTLGVLKAASVGLARVIRLPKEAGLITRTGVKLGRAGGAMIALHGIAELQTVVMKQRLMTWDERGEALFTNAVLMVALHAGKFITEPIETRVTKGVVAKLRLNKRIADRMDRVAAERLALKNRLAEVANGEMPPREVDKVIEETNQAWYEELKIIDDAATGEVINKGDVDTALAAHREHIAGMQLEMSQIGVEAPSPSGETTFRPIEPGVIAFAPEGRPRLEAAYNSADPAMPGKSLTESPTMPGVLEGRLPTGEVTYYVPEGKTGPIDIAPEPTAPKPVEAPKAAEPPKPPEPPKPASTDPVRDLLLRQAEQRIAEAEQNLRNAQKRANEAAENVGKAKTELEFYEAESKSDAAKARAKRAEATRLEKEAAARRKNPKRGDPLEAEKQAAEANGEADRLDALAEQSRDLVDRGREQKRAAAEDARKAKKDVPITEERSAQAKDSHERQVELSRRLDALEARYRSLPDVRSRPNMEPATGSEAGKLKWEIDSVKRQLYGEVAKAGVDVYARLRAASPGPAATRLALQNLKSLPKELIGPNENPIDVTTGKEMKPEDISPDHIYPLKSIAKEAGFSELTPRQQLEIAELTKNYMPLSETANSSKSGLTMEEWFKTPEGSKIPPKLRPVLMEIQAKARAHVQEEIAKMIKQNKSSSE